MPRRVASSSLSPEADAALDLAVLKFGLSRSQVIKEALTMWFEKCGDEELERWAASERESLIRERRLHHLLESEAKVQEIESRLLDSRHPEVTQELVGMLEAQMNNGCPKAVKDRVQRLIKQYG